MKLKNKKCCNYEQFEKQNCFKLAIFFQQQLSSLCSSIEDNILALQNIAADISTRVNKNLDPQVDQVRKEYENVKNLLKVQEIVS